MYEAYWRLEHRPFENTNDPRFYYPGESHQGTLLKLRYAVENRRGGAVLAGGSGTGKTLLVQALARQLNDSCQPFVQLVFPQMSAAELMAYLADELAAPPSPGRGLDHTVRRIKQFLSDNESRDKHAVVVVDEAHLIDDVQSLEALRLLLNFQPRQRAALTLLLVGQPRILPIIDRMPGLEERLAIKCLLRPLTLEETVSYVSHRLNSAGAKQQIFEPRALETLHALTHGLPRRINRLADLALLIGYAEGRSAISAEQIESVAQELVAVAPD
jgi:general secretion pathway protein A